MTTTVTPGASGSIGRGIALAVLAGILGAVATTILGGVLGMTGGLLVVASTTGWLVGRAIVLGGGAAIGRSSRAPIAIVVALAAVALGQLGLWLYARTEGGVLPLVGYLAETFGFLVPAQAAFAVVAAWWSAR